MKEVEWGCIIILLLALKKQDSMYSFYHSIQQTLCAYVTGQCIKQRKYLRDNVGDAISSLVQSKWCVEQLFQHLSLENKYFLRNSHIKQLSKRNKNILGSQIMHCTNHKDLSFFRSFSGSLTIFEF